MSNAVFVHGVPNTRAIWDPLIERLAPAERTIVRLAPPGFGTPVPAGFDTTAQSYADWLEAEVARLAAAGGRLDLVGHDWGGLLVWRVAARRAALLRSWTVIAAPVWPAYRWHLFARIWQTPGLGALSVHAVPRPVLAAVLRWNGAPRALACTEAAAADRTMRRAILRLYRSARTIQRDWARASVDEPARGLLVGGEADPYVPPRGLRAHAEGLGLAVHVEAGAGHWLIAERPCAVARVLRDHWIRAAGGDARPR